MEKLSSFYQDVRERSIDSLYYFTKVTLGYKDLTSEEHLDVCLFLEDTVSTDLLLVESRGVFKSTIGTVARNIWITLPRPESHPLHNVLGPHLHTLITNASDLNVMKWWKMIQRHWESNALLRGAFPDCIPTPTCANSVKEGLQLNNPYGKMIEGESTYMAKGLNTKVVSTHFDVRTHDDPVDEKTVRSPTLRAQAADNIAYIESCVRETSTFSQRVLIGTPYAHDDIVSLAKNDPDFKVFWKGCKDSNGELNFPNLLTEDKLARKLRQQGAYIYATQYALDSAAPEFASFPQGSLNIMFKRMDGVLILPPDSRECKVGDLDLVVAVDQATISNKYSKARSSIILFGMNKAHDVFAIDGVIGNLDPLETIEEIIRLYLTYPVRLIDIESGAYLATLQFWLEKVCEERNLWQIAACSQATPNPGGQGKDREIHLSLLPFAKARKFYCTSHLTEFALEWSRFPSPGQPYDGLDTARRALRCLMPDSELTETEQQYADDDEDDDDEFDFDESERVASFAY